METVKKIINVLAWVGELGLPALMVAAGIGFIVAGATRAIY